MNNNLMMIPKRINLYIIAGNEFRIQSLTTFIMNNIMMRSRMSPKNLDSDLPIPAVIL